MMTPDDVAQGDGAEVHVEGLATHGDRYIGVTLTLRFLLQRGEQCRTRPVLLSVSDARALALQLLRRATEAEQVSAELASHAG